MCVWGEGGGGFLSLSMYPICIANCHAQRGSPCYAITIKLKTLIGSIGKK